MESTQSHPNSHILGRPFLAAANACINCKTGAMDISFGNKKVKLNIFNATQGPRNDKDCFVIDSIDSIQESMEESSPLLLTKDPFQTCLTESPPQFELQLLPRTLKYIFLGPQDTLPVIIAAGLTPNQESQLIVYSNNIKVLYDGQWLTWKELVLQFACIASIVRIILSHLGRCRDGWMRVETIDLQ